MNVFAYCGNNPVGRIDLPGCFWDTVLDVISLVCSVSEVIIDPSGEAYIGLVLDCVDLIPFLTGTGEAYRAYRIADAFVDAFGDLSKAREYGIMGYNALRRALKGTGLHAHHIIEQRLVKHLDIDIGNMLSVAVTPAEHQKFTNAWRAVFKYGTDYTELTTDDIWQAAQKIYADYPELLEAAEEILFG